MQTRNVPTPLRRVLVAGPIGSGKSAVGSMLAARGALVLEADRIGHEVLEPEGPAFPAVAARFPGALRDGRIDRRRLAGIVFVDAHALEVLEALTHPHIAARLERRAAAAGDRLVVVELPLTTDILGPGWPRIVVLAEEELRWRRAVARGMDGADVRRRMAVQPPDDEWVAGATWVMHNDGTHEELAALVDAWWQREVAVA